ncbi:helix-turn-helix domain-containing protein [Clostridium saccharoperbutylacetonicum]
MKVITCGQVQEYLNDYYRNTREKLSFYEAYIQMTANGICGKDEKVESFLKWEIKNVLEFQEFYHKLPVETKSIKKNVNANGISEVVEDYLFPGKDAVILKYAYNTAIDLHLHNYFEIVYVVEGECSQVFEQEEIKIKKGEFLFIPPYKVHDILVDENSLVFGLLIRKSTFEQFFFEILQDNNPLSAFFNQVLYRQRKTCLHFSVEPSEKLLGVFQNIFEECYIQKSYSNQNCLNYVRILFVEILREIDSYNENTVGFAEENIPAILGYIRKYQKSITLEKLAEEFHYNKVYLGKLIKSKTGMNYNEILNQFRIHKGEELLINTKLSISEIAKECGYSSLDHFTRTFRKIKGISPLSFRKEKNIT